MSSIPSEGLVFYAPLKSDVSAAETGQALTKTGDMPFITSDNIPCAYFDGTTSGYTFTPTGFPTGNNPVSFSYWQKFHSNGTETVQIIFGYSGTGDGSGLITLTTSNKALFGFSGTGSGFDNCVAPGFDLDVWHHICVLSDTDNTVMYVDGELFTQFSMELSKQATYGAIGRIINYISEYQRFRGFLSSIRVYDRILTAAEITALYQEFDQAGSGGGVNILLSPATVAPAVGTPGLLYGNLFIPLAPPPTPIPTDGLVFHAPLAEAAAAAVTGQTFTANGTIVYETVGGVAAARFNGSSYIKYPLTNMPSGDNPSFTFSAWIRTNSPTSNYQTFSNWGSSGADIGTAVYNSGGQQVALFGGQSLETFGAIQFDPATWHHLLFTHEGTTDKIYIDGVFDSQAAKNRNNVNASGSGNIGGYNTQGQHNGWIAAYRVYNRVLDSDEITALAAEFTPAS